MSAGQVWRRPDGLRWVEIEAEPVEASGWRLMVPLVATDEAPDAPPLVITLDRWRARVHLLTSASHNELGEAEAQLPPHEIEELQAAARTLLGGA